MADPLVFGRSRQLSQDKFFYPSTPSMRKGRNRGETGGKNRAEKNRGENKKIKMFLVAINVVASRPPERPWTGMLTACAKRKREHIKNWKN